MATVFNSPVLTVVCQNLCCGGQILRFTGDSIGNYTGSFSAFSIVPESFDLEGLGDMRKVQMWIKFCGYPNFSCLLTAMGGLVMDRVVWLPVDVFKKCFEFFVQVFLIIFGSEVVMGVSFFNDVSSQFSLGE